MATITEVVELIPEWWGKEVSIEPLSAGITNSNFKIVVNGSSFFISISGRYSGLLGADWYSKYHNAKISGQAGLAPKVLHHLQNQKALVLEYIPLPHCSGESLKSPAVQLRFVRTLKQLHGGASFWRDFDMFCLIEFYMKTIKDRGIDLPARYADFRERIWEMGEALAQYREVLVPCHNDLAPENVMDDGGRVYLLDFDYSSNNDPCFDLGSISVEAGYDDKQVRELARAYFGLVSENIVARIYLHGVLGDVGWSLWSVIQSEVSGIDFDFKAYGLRRWNRAVERMDSSNFDRWLWNVRSIR